MARGDEAGASDGAEPAPPVASGRTGWPAPHPSPPLPPPREYGAPGVPPARGPLVLVVVLVVVAVLVVVGVLLLVFGGDSDDRSDDRSTDPRPSRSATAASGAGSSGASSAAAAAYTCWDGTPAAALDDCTEPTGRAGLEWVFPSLADQKCVDRPPPAGEGTPAFRVLCVAKLEDGTKLQVGYVEWPSVQSGYDFYEADGLRRQDVEDGAGQVASWLWLGRGQSSQKGATMYATDPFSVSVTVGTPARRQELLGELVAPRPVAEVRGVPSS